MTFFLIFILLIIVLNLYFFLSRSFSPIPYFPTNKNDLDLIIETCELKKEDVVYDLGAGTGTFVFRAVQTKPDVQFKALEIHPTLVLIMWVKRLFLPNKAQIQILWQDLFKTNIGDATKIYLYVGPYVMQRIMQKIFNDKPKNLKRIVSYMYNFQLGKVNCKNIRYQTKVIQGERKIYVLDFI